MFLSSIRPTDYDPLELSCILWDGKMRTERVGVGDHVAVESEFESEETASWLFLGNEPRGGNDVDPLSVCEWEPDSFREEGVGEDRERVERVVLVVVVFVLGFRNEGAEDGGGIEGFAEGEREGEESSQPGSFDKGREEGERGYEQDEVDFRDRGRFSGLVLVTKLWMRLDGLFVCEVDSRVTPNNGSIVEPVVGDDDLGKGRKGGLISSNASRYREQVV